MPFKSTVQRVLELVLKNPTIGVFDDKMSNTRSQTISKREGLDIWFYNAIFTLCKMNKVY